MYLALKILITALIVVTVSEIARRSTLIAGIIASVPLTSVLAITWLYLDTKNIKTALLKILNLFYGSFIISYS